MDVCLDIPQSPYGYVLGVREQGRSCDPHLEPRVLDKESCSLVSQVDTGASRPKAAAERPGV